MNRAESIIATATARIEAGFGPEASREGTAAGLRIYADYVAGRITAAEFAVQVNTWDRTAQENPHLGNRLFCSAALATLRSAIAN